MKNSDTKERILNEAIKLFAEKGYEAVSVSDIADAVGIKAPSLYKHYKSKSAIFESILNRMRDADYQKAKNYEMPDGNEKITEISFETIRGYSKAMLAYWTEESFSCSFRKMLTIEQYKSEKMAKLYENYISCGPVEYMADIFSVITSDREEAYSLAVGFYGPMYLLYGIYDKTNNLQLVMALLDKHITEFSAMIKIEKTEENI